MNLLSLFTNHDHYWGIPHERPADGRLVQTCYECGSERLIKVELRALYNPKFPHRESGDSRKLEHPHENGGVKERLPLNEILVKFAALLTGRGGHVRTHP